ncbi:unnamed protein product [Toxocara canis]|uniref:RSN1_7TM domain-containing protein n=1 Tax=Toxocara canis TaxID=6265 RepID=A0A183UGC1_TOXCA|nr:unnamed protein product [Toxocara canis]
MDLINESRPISRLDYAVFALSLFLSVGTGIYHAIRKRTLTFIMYSTNPMYAFRSRLLLTEPGTKTSQKDEYMMGGRKMPPIPVALSLLTTFLSGILMLGVPAEMFERGLSVALDLMFIYDSSMKYLGAQIWLNFVIGAASSVITAIFFLPIFYRMKSTCLHEYFIYRYSKAVQIWFSRKLRNDTIIIATLVSNSY